MQAAAVGPGRITGRWMERPETPTAFAEGSDPGPQKDVIEALGKGLRVIEAFNESNARMTASETGEVAGISRAAARRYLLSLCHFGYAQTDGRRFWLEPRVLRLGQSYLEAARLPRLVQPFLERLSIGSGETASMSILDNHEVVFLGQGRGSRAPAGTHSVGSRVPGHVVAAGYAVMTTRPDREVDAWAASHEFAAYTPHTVKCADQFLREVEGARRRGYAWCDQQLHMGLAGIALPLQDRKGKCIGALALTLNIRHSTREEATERYVPLLAEARDSIRHIL